MKRALGLLAATALLASGALALGTGSVGAAATSTPVVPLVQNIDLTAPKAPGSAVIYAVHGLNLAGQTAQTDGGTAVTVCVDGVVLLPDFQFGDIENTTPIPWGTPLAVKVFLGANADCAGTNAAISADIVVPEEEAVALVATAGPGQAPELLPVVLNVSTPRQCLQDVVPAAVENAPQGAPVEDSRLGAVHAAAAGQVAVSVDGTDAGELSFGDPALFANLPNGTYSVEVTLGGTPIVGPADIDVPPCTLTVVYVVGNQPIAEPTTTTTAPAPAAAAVTAAPAFTG